MMLCIHLVVYRTQLLAPFGQKTKTILKYVGASFEFLLATSISGVCTFLHMVVREVTVLALLKAYALKIII